MQAYIEPILTGGAIILAIAYLARRWGRLWHDQNGSPCGSCTRCSDRAGTGKQRAPIELVTLQPPSRPRASTDRHSGQLKPRG